jgi:RES domain-containing protein
MLLKPHEEFERLAASVRRAVSESGPWEGILYRSTSTAYARSKDLLDGEGSKRVGGRWNPPGLFTAVYGSLSPEAAMAETLEHARYYDIQPWRLMRRVFCALEVRLARTLDLTRGDVRHRIRVSHERMIREDWRQRMSRGEEALTQAIGRAAFEAGLEALVVPSAALRRGRNLLVFPQNLSPTSRLVEVDAQRLRRTAPPK